MDHIKLLLETTGLSADDLIKTLAEYKKLSSEAAQTKDVPESINKSEGPSNSTRIEKNDLGINSDNNINKNISLVTSKCDNRLNKTDNFDSVDIVNTNIKDSTLDTRLKSENGVCTKNLSNYNYEVSSNNVINIGEESGYNEDHEIYSNISDDDFELIVSESSTIDSLNDTHSLKSHKQRDDNKNAMLKNDKRSLSKNIKSSPEASVNKINIINSYEYMKIFDEKNSKMSAVKEKFKKDEKYNLLNIDNKQDFKISLKKKENVNKNIEETEDEILDFNEIDISEPNIHNENFIKDQEISHNITDDNFIETKKKMEYQVKENFQTNEDKENMHVITLTEKILSVDKDGSAEVIIMEHSVEVVEIPDDQENIVEKTDLNEIQCIIENTELKIMTDIENKDKNIVEIKENIENIVNDNTKDVKNSIESPNNIDKSDVITLRENISSMDKDNCAEVIDIQHSVEIMELPHDEANIMEKTDLNKIRCEESINGNTELIILRENTENDGNNSMEMEKKIENEEFPNKTKIIKNTIQSPKSVDRENIDGSPEVINVEHNEEIVEMPDGQENILGKTDLNKTQYEESIIGNTELIILTENTENEDKNSMEMEKKIEYIVIDNKDFPNKTKIIKNSIESPRSIDKNDGITSQENDGSPEVTNVEHYEEIVEMPDDQENIVGKTDLNKIQCEESIIGNTELIILTENIENEDNNSEEKEEKIEYIVIDKEKFPNKTKIIKNSIKSPKRVDSKKKDGSPEVINVENYEEIVKMPDDQENIFGKTYLSKIQHEESIIDNTELIILTENTENEDNNSMEMGKKMEYIVIDNKEFPNKTKIIKNSIESPQSVDKNDGTTSRENDGSAEVKNVEHYEEIVEMPDDQENIVGKTDLNKIQCEESIIGNTEFIIPAENIENEDKNSMEMEEKIEYIVIDKEEIPNKTKIIKNSVESSQSVDKNDVITSGEDKDVSAHVTNVDHHEEIVEMPDDQENIAGKKDLNEMQCIESINGETELIILKENIKNEDTNSMEMKEKIEYIIIDNEEFPNKTKIIKNSVQSSQSVDKNGVITSGEDKDVSAQVTNVDHYDQENIAGKTDLNEMQCIESINGETELILKENIENEDKNSMEMEEKIEYIVSDDEEFPNETKIIKHLIESPQNIDRNDIATSIVNIPSVDKEIISVEHYVEILEMPDDQENIVGKTINEIQCVENINGNTELIITTENIESENKNCVNMEEKIEYIVIDNEEFPNKTKIIKSSIESLQSVGKNDIITTRENIPSLDKEGSAEVINVDHCAEIVEMPDDQENILWKTDVNEIQCLESSNEDKNSVKVEEKMDSIIIDKEYLNKTKSIINSIESPQNIDGTQFSNVLKEHVQIIHIENIANVEIEEKIDFKVSNHKESSKEFGNKENVSQNRRNSVETKHLTETVDPSENMENSSKIVENLVSIDNVTNIKETIDDKKEKSETPPNLEDSKKEDPKSGAFIEKPAVPSTENNSSKIVDNLENIDNVDLANIRESIDDEKQDTAKPLNIDKPNIDNLELNIEETIHDEKQEPDKPLNIVESKKEDPKNDSFIEEARVAGPSSENKRRPILGCIRKSADSHKQRKIYRCSNSSMLPGVQRSEEEKVSTDEDVIKSPESTRKKIFNQLKKLRRKIDPAEGTLLGPIVNPISKIYTARIRKAPELVNTEVPENKFGIKILQVRGGIKEGEIDILKSQELIKPVDDGKETGIQLSKTKDFKKIKGWKKKYFLNLPKKEIKEVSNCPSIKAMKFKPIPTDDPIPSCSYTHPDLETPKIEEKVENEENKNIENISAFASNTLDGFLEEQKKLDPKMVMYDDINIGELAPIVNEPKPETIHNSRYGNMRRHFTMATHEDADCINQNIKTDLLKPRTLAEKRKLLEAENNENIPVKIQKIETLTLEESMPKNSFNNIIYFRSKRVKVHGYYKSKAYRISYPKKNEYRVDRIKPSILKASCPKETPIKIKYRPGPLSRKKMFQNGPSKQWLSEIKHLPQVYLEVKPQLRRNVHPQIRHFLNFNTFDISEERADFALSALLANKTDENVYKFKIPYAHNQERIILRTKANEAAIPIKEHVAGVEENKHTIATTISNVLNDLITCIENREISEVQLQEDPDFEVEEKIEEISKIKSYSQLSKSERQALPKADLLRGKNIATLNELKRLNVKIIEVNIEDETESTETCLKSHCRLGCVCKSLKSGVPLTEDHCSETKCIFQCICGYEKMKLDRIKFMLPVGTELLSDRTVSRLQDAAKKHLAKVEAEFTQTVIHANNQTIVVGDKTERKKRIARVPKKYEDYLDARVEHETIEELEDIKDAPFVSILNGPSLRATPDNFPPVPCSISLQRHDFSNIIPFCLEHNLYECHCNFEAEYTNNRINSSYQMYQHEIQKVGVELLNKRIAARPLRYETGPNDREISCARTRGTAAQFYIIRNKTNVFKRRISHKLGLEGEQSPILQKWIATAALVHATLLDSPKPSETIEIDDDNDPLLKPMGVGSVYGDAPNRRKQKLQVRNEIPSKKIRLMQEKAIQRRRFKNRTATTTTSASQMQKIMDSKDKIKPKTIDEVNKSNEAIAVKTNMYTPTTAISTKFAELLGQGSRKGSYFRLLQWSVLMARYLTKSIEIWCTSTNNKLKLIVTDKNVDMEGHANIRVFENVTDKENIPIDVIRWIVCRKIPEGKNGEDILVILNMSNVFCEICGICAKNKPLNSDKPMSISLLRDSITKPNDEVQSDKKKKVYTKNRIELIKNQIENMKTKIESMENKETAINQEPAKVEQTMATIEPVQKLLDKTKELVNVANNKYKTVQQVAFAKGDFTLKKLVAIELQNEELQAALPNSSVPCKWRMLSVNSNFSILSFSRNQFRIKCSDIITVMKVALKYNKTIIINTDDISKNYRHTLFGIYLVPSFQDRIFIGPYYMNELHDIETLRFVNNVLVNTELFNKMRGNTKHNCTGVWYQQVAAPTKISVIDLTDNDEELIKNNEGRIHIKKMTNSPRSILKSNFIKKPVNTDEAVVEQVPFNPDLVNQGIIKMMNDNCTPLPADCKAICFSVNFDKLIIHGYKETCSEAIHVFWPGNINYQFSRPFRDLTAASNWLQEQLINSLMCIPKSYKIKVQVLAEAFYNNPIFFTQWKSLTNKHFMDLYVVGLFGGLPLMELVEYVTTPKPELTKAYSLKCISERNPIHSLRLFKTAVAEFESDAADDYPDFLRLVRAQIIMETFRQRRLHEAKIEMKAKNVELLQKHTSLIKKVDPTVRGKIKDEFMKVYHIASPVRKNIIHPTKSNVDEVICLDSDDDSKEQGNNDNSISDSDTLMTSTEEVKLNKRLCKKNSESEINSETPKIVKIKYKKKKQKINKKQILCKIDGDVKICTLNTIDATVPIKTSNSTNNDTHMDTDISVDLTSLPTLVLPDTQMNVLLNHTNTPTNPEFQTSPKVAANKVITKLPPKRNSLAPSKMQNVYTFKKLSKKFFGRKRKNSESIASDPALQPNVPVHKPKLLNLDEANKLSVLNLDLSHVNMKQVMGILGDPNAGEQITLTKEQLLKLKSLKKTKP